MGSRKGLETKLLEHVIMYAFYYVFCIASLTEFLRIECNMFVHLCFAGFDRWLITSLVCPINQDDCSGRHWRRWRQASTSPVTTRAVTLTTLPVLCPQHLSTGTEVPIGEIFVHSHTINRNFDPFRCCGDEIPTQSTDVLVPARFCLVPYIIL